MPKIGNTDPDRYFLFPTPIGSFTEHPFFGLKPGTSYSIKFGDLESEYYFTTMPADIAKEPIRVAVSGDTLHDQAFMEKTNNQVVKYDPHFAAIGGDLAYANGNPDNVKR